MIIKVTDNSTLPIMKAVGYVGQAKDELKASLAHRREMLSYVKPVPRLKCVGEDETGLHFIEAEEQHPIFV